MSINLHYRTSALIVGADSNIGSSLFNSFSRAGFDVVGTSRRKYASCLNCLYLDLNDLNTLSNLKIVHMTLQLYALALLLLLKFRRITNMLTRLMSPILSCIDVLSKIARNILLVHEHVTRNYKFYSASSPLIRAGGLIVYGHHKYAVEQYLLSLNTRVAVLRLSVIQIP